MLSVEAREAADSIFEVFCMTQLRIKPSLPRFYLILKLSKSSDYYVCTLPMAN